MEDSTYPYRGTSSHGDSCFYSEQDSTYLGLSSYVRSTSTDVTAIKELVAA